MGLPSKSELEEYTDLVAAIMAANLAGFRAEYDNKAVTTLFDLVDASSDPIVQNALGAAALDVDEQSLPERTADALAAVVNRPKIKAWAQALTNLVKSAGGGGYADLRAALAARNAIIHPLYAELERRWGGGEAIFTSGGDVLNVAPPAYACIRPTRLYVGEDGSWTDDTVDAQDSDTADVALFAADDDKVLIGCDRPFTQVIFGLSTVSSHDVGLSVKYWNGNTFVPVPDLTDNSAGLTKNQNISWTLPPDWVRTNQDAGGDELADLARLYYIELQRSTNTVDTPPTATCVSLVPTPILNANGQHLGVPASMPQPPLALVRITDQNVAVVEPIAEIAYARFKEPTTQLVARALSAISGSVTFTLAYVNDAGANKTKAQSAWSSIAALGTLALTLDSDGLRSVRPTGHSSTHTAIDGVFAIECQDLRAPTV